MLSCERYRSTMTPEQKNIYDVVKSISDKVITSQNTKASSDPEREAQGAN